MNEPIMVFWSFRSPYSYIALPRLIALSQTHGVALEMRVVHPAALRNPDYFRSMNPLARPYFLRDSAREAAARGMKFRRPVPDPVAQDPATLAIAQAQPLARRLGRLGVAASQRGAGIAFCLEVSRLLWDGEVDGWDTGDHLARAAARAGLDLAALDEAVAADPDGHEAVLAQNDQDLRASGHWGVPTMVWRGEPFFGQDRIDTLAWRLRGGGG
ncbi:MAG TPA: DsbA family protein [Acidiphilium sp.]|nr:DsbA family protein [Acidiphilium sp.]